LSQSRERERERENCSQNDNHQIGQPSNRQFHQGVIVKNKGTEAIRETNICSTLLARDYKGFGNQETTGVIVYEM